MQKLFCLLLTLTSLTAISQDRIDFYSPVAVAKQRSVVSDKIIRQAYNNDGHTLELVFTVPAAQQHLFRNITATLRTQAGQLDFIIPGETTLESRNRLRFTANSGNVYVYVNDILRLEINDAQHAFSICTPGYSCSLIDAESNKDIAIQAERITVGYRPFIQPSSKPPLTTHEPVNELKEIKIFPNPVLNSVHIISGKGAPVSITVLNAEGKLINTKMIPGQTELDVTELPAGLYFLRIDTDKNEHVVRSFIKQ